MFSGVLRRAARRPVHLVTSAEQCQAVVERLLSSSLTSVAVDCEGTRLGRFGSLSLVQLATDQEVFLLDAVQGGKRLVQPLVPLLESRDMVKVFHDCREDASLLLHQHTASLASVFDTQVGFIAWLERKGLELYQASVAEVLRTFRMGTYRAHRWDELERKPVLPHRWQHRPLSPEAVRYAVEGVAHLLPLQRAICRELGDPTGDLVLRRSVRYVEYAQLNRAELPMQDLSGLRQGAPLQAMMATRREDSVYFKINHSQVTGAALDAEDIREFQDLQPGDVVPCRVKFLSDCGQFVHLQREGHGNLFYDFRQRRMRPLPSQEEVDALFPDRQSSLYGHGQPPQGARPAIIQERSNFKEQKPEVIYKQGKRGQVKVRPLGIKLPKGKAKRDADHRSFSPE